MLTTVPPKLPMCDKAVTRAYYVDQPDLTVYSSGDHADHNLLTFGQSA